MTPDVAVWCFPLADVDVHAAEAVLSEAERDRGRQLPHDARLRFIRVRASLRRALVHAGVAPSATIVAGAHGKPRLAEERGVFFSVAHAGTWACIAVATSAEVGVDAEPVDGERPGRAVATRFFAAQERSAELVGTLAGLETWTRREAVLKAAGVGLGVDPEAFAVSVPPEPPFVRAVRDPRFAGPMRMERIAVDGVLVGTLAVRAAAARVRLVRAVPAAITPRRS